MLFQYLGCGRERVVGFESCIGYVSSGLSTTKFGQAIFDRLEIKSHVDRVFGAQMFATSVNI